MLPAYKQVFVPDPTVNTCPPQRPIIIVKESAPRPPRSKNLKLRKKPNRRVQYKSGKFRDKYGNIVRVNPAIAANAINRGEVTYRHRVFAQAANKAGQNYLNSLMSDFNRTNPSQMDVETPKRQWPSPADIAGMVPVKDEPLPSVPTQYLSPGLGPEQYLGDYNSAFPPTVGETVMETPPRTHHERLDDILRALETPVRVEDTPADELIQRTQRRFADYNYKRNLSRSRDETPVTMPPKKKTSYSNREWNPDYFGGRNYENRDAEGDPGPMTGGWL